MGKFHDDVKDQVVAIWETVIDGWGDAIQFVQETWPALLILLIGLMVALALADPAPPKRVVMGIGAHGMSYETLGKQYAQYFAKRGITLELVPTAGSVENIQRLQDRKDPMVAAFVLSGTADPGAVPNVESLGSIDYQPLWFFYRDTIKLPSEALLRDLAKLHTKLRINIGPQGSGTNLVAHRVMQMNAIKPGFFDTTDFPEVEAIQAFRQGKLDALFIVDSFDAKNVQSMLAMDHVKVANFTRAEAYTRVAPSLEKVTIPEGAISLSRNMPTHEINLVAATTEILVDSRLHPAIQMLFLMAARSINGPQKFFSQEGEFPVYKDTTLKRSPEAELYYEKGIPVLMSYLPFWLAEFIHRMSLLLLPFALAAYPIIQSMPNYHKNRVRGKINRMYGALKFFEQELMAAYNPAQKATYLAQLDEMERNALAMRVPKAVSSDYYTLRGSIDFVRGMLLRDGYAVHQGQQG